MKPKTRRRAPPRVLRVLRKASITPHMLRVTLGGPGLNGFPEDSNGGYIKLHLDSADSEPAKTLIRTYTVRYYKADLQELDVDFVIHDSEGPAATWAQTCEPGDEIKVGGPGPKKLLDFDADWFLLVGDMSALPAISANIERMSSDAKGYALIEILDEQDKQELDIPKNLQIEWVVNPHPEKQNSVLLDKVKSLEWLAGRPSV